MSDHPPPLHIVKLESSDSRPTRHLTQKEVKALSADPDESTWYGKMPPPGPPFTKAIAAHLMAKHGNEEPGGHLLREK